MSVCPKCIIGGVVQGGSLMPADDVVELSFTFMPVSDGEMTGERSLEFQGEVGDVGADGSLVARGPLRGNFALDPSADREEDAVLETFTRDGLVTLGIVTVSDGEVVTFSATLRALHKADAIGLQGNVFVGGLVK